MACVSVRTHGMMVRLPATSMDKDFVEFVKKQSESEKRTETQLPKAIEARRKWWIKAVKDLFAKVQVWLEPLIKDGAVTFNTIEVQIMDDGLLGSYKLQRAIIGLGRKTLEMNPVGSMIFGSFGRIDVTGPNGKLMLILEATHGTEENDFVPTGGQWFITKRVDSGRLQEELTKEVFERVFKDLFGLNA